MKITVLGSGDTRGTPKLGCACPTCQAAQHDGFERTRFGLVLEENNHRVLIDASPDLRAQLFRHRLSPSDFDAVLLTHEHYDHVAGLGEFFSTGKAMPVFGLSGTLSRVFSETNYGYLLESGVFRLFPTEFFQTFCPEGFDVLPLKVDHSIETQGFLVNRKLALLTDTRPHLFEETKNAIQNIPLLLTDGLLENDAQFRSLISSLPSNALKKHSAKDFQNIKLNHMLIGQAQELGKEVHAEKTVVLHISHACSPHSVLTSRYDSETFQIGYDGLTLSV